MNASGCNSNSQRHSGAQCWNTPERMANMADYDLVHWNTPKNIKYM